MLKFSKLVVIASLVLGISLLASERAHAGDDTPLLPDDIKITCAVEPESFCGTWGDGKWSGVLPHTLVVDFIDPDGRVTFIYAWGVASEWRIYEAGFLYVEGRIEDGELTAILPSGTKVSYTHIDDGGLRGKYKNSRGTAQIILARLTH